jgi:putative membrane protein
MGVGHDSVWYYLPVAAVLFFPVYSLVKRLPFLSLPFISRTRLTQAVRDRALRAFYEQGLHRTAHATGVLIFISLFERRVWILGDRGINERIAQQEWDAMIEQLVTGIGQQQITAALCAVIGRCGVLLRTHFPPQSADANELSDDVILL